MSCLTVWALFGDDLRVILTNRAADVLFNVSFLFCFAVFAAEILASCMCKQGYIMGFFFFLDIFSTLSILLDVGWISNTILGQSQGGSGNQVARAAEASKIGARAARILRILRLIRLIRIVKLYKAAAQRKKKDKSDPKQLDPVKPKAEGDLKDSIKLRESNVPQSKLVDRLNGSGEPRDRQRNPGKPEDPGLPPRRNQRFESVVFLGQNSGLGDRLTPEEEQEVQKDLLEFENEQRLRDQRLIEDSIKETEVGKQVSFNITKILISLIMLIMVSVPLFTNETYSNDLTPQGASVDMLAK